MILDGPFETDTLNATTLSSSPNTDGKNRNLAYTFDCILDPLSPLHHSKIRKNLVGSGGKLGLRITRYRIVATSGMGFKVDHQYNRWDVDKGVKEGSTGGKRREEKKPTVV
ncbi:hypothetical protein BOTNAR_0217g00030 [Botryotinia narcissicola]|uniref:Uncharacterized protein n=1 Tax=Botryotinia narcissicola TaxID=278944 RepID=A0A4Z1IJ20_9HELO|nr:hypothetical protein BOTNAR_0217g00030 [Botryotinia narcissicola]